MKHRIVGLALLVLTGCQNITGPFKRNSYERPDDPSYTTAEQNRRVRDRLPLPDESNLSGPHSGAAARAPNNALR